MEEEKKVSEETKVSVQEANPYSKNYGEDDPEVEERSRQRQPEDQEEAEEPHMVLRAGQQVGGEAAIGVRVEREVGTVPQEDAVSSSKAICEQHPSLLAQASAPARAVWVDAADPEPS